MSSLAKYEEDNENKAEKGVGCFFQILSLEAIKAFCSNNRMLKEETTSVMEKLTMTLRLNPELDGAALPVAE